MSEQYHPLSPYSFSLGNINFLLYINATGILSDRIQGGQVRRGENSGLSNRPLRGRKRWSGCDGGRAWGRMFRSSRVG